MKLVFGISPPRSGTAWLSNFLTWGNSHVMHEALFGVSCLNEFEKKLELLGRPLVGSMDTAACFIAPALYQRFPNAKYLIVVRPREAVCESQRKCGIEPDVTVVYEGLHWAFENIPSEQTMVLDFNKMFNQITMREVWDFIEHPDPFPFERMEMLRGMFVEDGFKTGFGRFVDKSVVEENLNKFSMLQESCYPNIASVGMNKTMLESLH